MARRLGGLIVQTMLTQRRPEMGVFLGGRSNPPTVMGIDWREQRRCTGTGAIDQVTQLPQQVELVAPPVEVCEPVWSTLSVAHCVSLAWVPMAVAVIT
jgi:hypothetical protein